MRIIIWLGILSFSYSELRKFIPKLHTEEGLELWKRQLDGAVKRQLSNKTARNGMLTEDVFTITGSVFVQGEPNLACEACKIGVNVINYISKIPYTEELIKFAIRQLCLTVEKSIDSVCRGIAESSGDAFLHLLDQANSDHPLFETLVCFAAARKCPEPERIPTSIKLPPFKKVMPPRSSNKKKLILHLSDIHFDPEYTEGTEVNCKKPVCCQPDSNDENIFVNKPANPWGEYKCDASQPLLESLLNAANKEAGELGFDMVLFTGDIPAHDLWKESVSRTESTSFQLFSMLSIILGENTRRFTPVIGNHEAVPVNQFPVNPKSDFRLYNYMADMWQEWLPDYALHSLRLRGSFSFQHSKFLKVIIVNTNLCYTYNWDLIIDPDDNDPGNILAWLISELNSAELNQSQVYLIGHVPPGSVDCYKNWSEAYYKIIQRFHPIVISQFYGHLHTDEFQLFYNNQSKSTQSAISHAYLAPSATPNGGQNPGFRIYEVDSRSYQILDYTQYYANLSESATWVKDIEWKPLYSARNFYDPQDNLDSTQPLTPSFWHQVTEQLETDVQLFHKFDQLRYLKGPGYQLSNNTQIMNMICTLRAGKSADTCNTYEPFA